MKLSFFTILSVVTAIAVSPLPKPISMTWSNDGERSVDSNIQLSMSQHNDLVFGQFNDMMNTLHQLKWYPAATEAPKLSYPPTPTGPSKRQHVESSIPHLSVLKVTIDDYNADLQYGVDESYNLTVGKDIEINAVTVWGCLHAFKTLQQIIIFEDNQFKIESGVQIVDYPLLKHRGVLIDSGRNFLTTDSIKENIDLMSLTKLNTLHWHLEDTASWPLEVKTFPEMIHDAYSVQETYTQAQISDIIGYARTKGVRVVPEIDFPGHANAGWKSIDNANVLSCENGWWDFGIAAEPPPGQLDISKDETYNVVEKVYKELSNLFPDNYFHVGHDELNENCYNFSDSVYDYYEKNNQDFFGLVQYWVNKSQPIFLADDSKRLIMWEDIITSENATLLNKDKIIIQSWLGNSSIKALTNQGFDTIISNYEHYYLDCGFGGWVTNNTASAGSWCDPYKNWQNIYSYDFYEGLTEEESSHIVGAEVALWSEMVDSNNMVSKLWSRAGAFAEVAWSGNKENGSIRLYEFTQRMFNFREYVVALGHKVDPLAPKYCWQIPHSCDI